ncbi:MAG: amino acid ABC transporter permease [Desulfoprunum sp.]
MPRLQRQLGRLDWFVLAGLIGAAVFLLYRMFFNLNYNWNWGIIPTYLVRYDDEQQRWVANALLEGLVTTIRLSVWGMLLALALGVILGVMRVATRLAPRLLSRVYIEFIRNTPALVLVFLFYYFVNDRLLSHFEIDALIRHSPAAVRRALTLAAGDPTLISPFISGAMTIGLFQAAYIAEIVRAGIQSIPAGQWEASRSLGLPKFLVLRLVILPQAIRVMLPPLAGEFINTIKYSSIVSIISIQELTFQGMQVMASTQATIEIWITITAMYLVLCLGLSLAVHRLERKYRRTLH